MTGFRAAFVAVLALVLVACPAVANARFTSSSGSALPVASDTLVAPTLLTVKCQGSAQRVTIGWTATVDAYATGYVIYTAYAGTETSQSVSGSSTTTYTPVLPVPAGAVITMVSVYRNWTSARSSSTTAPASCH